MTDPISDMLSRIRNATIGRYTRVDMPSSRLKVEIARILEAEGYIQGFKVIEPQNGWGAAGAPADQVGLTARAESASSRGWSGSAAWASRLLGRDEVPDAGGASSARLTTSRGVMTGREAAESGSRRRSAL